MEKKLPISKILHLIYRDISQYIADMLKYIKKNVIYCDISWYLPFWYVKIYQNLIYQGNYIDISWDISKILNNLIYFDISFYVIKYQISIYLVNINDISRIYQKNIEYGIYIFKKYCIFEILIYHKISFLWKFRIKNIRMIYFDMFKYIKQTRYIEIKYDISMYLNL